MKFLGSWLKFRVGRVSGNTTIFSSPELKAQMSFSDRRLSVVLLSVRLSVNFYIFNFFSRTTGPILTILGTNHLWREGNLNFQMKGKTLAQGEIIAKMNWTFLKIFSRTNTPISIKLGTNYPWVKGILNCSY
jgi:hypothetical protein